MPPCNNDLQCRMHDSEPMVPLLIQLLLGWASTWTEALPEVRKISSRSCPYGSPRGKDDADVSKSPSESSESGSKKFEDNFSVICHLLVRLQHFYSTHEARDPAASVA